MSYLLFEGRPLTTRGRWINSLVFANLWVLKKLPISTSVNKPLFIIGTGRSGSTVLGLVLSMHKDIAFLNEPKALWHSVYKNEDLIGSYTDRPALYRLKKEDASEIIIRELRRIYSAYEFITGHKRVLDKYPELIFRIGFVRAIFPDARFIFLVRNGIDTCLSIKSWSEQYGSNNLTETNNWWGRNERKWLYIVDQLVDGNKTFSSKKDQISRISDHTDRAAVEWVVTMQEGLRIQEEYPETIKMIRYEELIENPVKILTEIFRFIDLDIDNRALNYASSKLRSSQSQVKSLTINPIIQTEFNAMLQQLGYLK